jgi:DNA-directed RNA polymerase subunit E'/Rpb7
MSSNRGKKSTKRVDIIDEDEKIVEVDNTQTISSKIQSPYINTTLVCPIMLKPPQMDNKLYLHLKTNLINKLEGKCYQNYGYIKKIHKIEETSEGIIEAEDSTSSAKIIVKFSCILCFPAKNKEIICKIIRINKALIGGTNGPIITIIQSDHFDREKFYIDTERNIRIKESSKLLESNMYIRVLVLQSSFVNYDTKIVAVAYLQDMATEDEIKLYEKEHLDNE